MYAQYLGEGKYRISNPRLIPNTDWDETKVFEHEVARFRSMQSANGALQDDAWVEAQAKMSVDAEYDRLIS